MGELLYGFSEEDGYYSHAVGSEDLDITICKRIEHPSTDGPWTSSPEPRCGECTRLAASWPSS